MGKTLLLDTRKSIIIYKAIKYLFYVKKKYSIILFTFLYYLGQTVPCSFVFQRVGLHSDLL